MYRFFILLFLCYLFPTGRMQAQTTEDKTPQYAISIEPMYLSNGGLGLNLEKKIRSNHWVELNLKGYYLPHGEDIQEEDFLLHSWYSEGYITINSNFNRISGLSGLGIGATYKYYFFRRYMVNTTFSYNWYNVEYAAYNFYPYIEDGLTFYDYTWTDIHQTFHKLGLQVAIGVRSKFERWIFAEPYAGLGYTCSFYNQDKQSFNETMFGYGYQGFYLTAGIKLGLNLQKK